MAANANIGPVTLMPDLTQADFEIKLKLVDGMHALPDVPSPVMKVGKTLRYSCSDGPFRVVYVSKSDPSLRFEIGDSGIRRLEVDGSFQCRCFITRKDGKEVGWSETLSPQSGGEPVITPRP